MTRHLAVVSFVVACVVLTSGCGTIIHGSTQAINFDSNPQGATVSVGGTRVRTPATLNLERNKHHQVTIELAGYETQRLEIQKQLDPWIFGNILIGGVPGIVIDLITGSAAALKPENVFVDFEKR